MDGLRLLLLLIGLILIAGVYLWGSRLGRRRAQAAIERASAPRRQAPSEPAPRIAAKPEEEVDVAEALSDLGRLTAAEDKPPARRAGMRRDRPRARTRQTSLDFGERGAEQEFQPEQPPAAESERLEPADQGPAPVLEPGYVALYVSARPGRAFTGRALRESFEELGMELGEFGTFDHHGVGASRTAQRVFSAANMFEPGIFDRDSLDAFQTGGIVLFMPLPTPLDGKVAAELLLSSAQRLAQRLEGDLQNDRRQPLAPVDIETLRRQAASHGTASPA